MPFHPVQNCTRVEIRWQAGTNLCENTFAYRWNAPAPSAAELSALAAAIGGDLATWLRRCMHNGITFREVHAWNANAPGGAQGTYTFPPNTTGQRAGAAVALSEASGITKRTGFMGRSNKGRNSISGFIEGDVDGNTLSNTLMSLLGDLAIHMLTSYISGRFTPGVASVANNTIIPLASALVLDSDVDSQKTRLNRHGNT